MITNASVFTFLTIEDEIGYDAEDIDRDNIAARLKQDAVSFSTTHSCGRTRLQFSAQGHNN
jgi:hypothetical protein